MNRLIAMCSFLLSLYGCDVGQSTFVHHVRVDGADILHSRVVAQAGNMRFECLGSASGQCHYTVEPNDCAVGASPGASPVDRCVMRPVERFSLTRGETRRVPGTDAGRVCVSADAAEPGPACEVMETVLALR